MENRNRAESFALPIVGGLVVLVTLLGLIGTAIRDPKPHDIPVGIVGPAPAAQQLSAGVGASAPGAFQFTAYASEALARTALDNRDIVAALVLGNPPRLIVAQAAGEALTAVPTAIFTAVFAAQGAQLSVETIHPYSSGDPHGLVLFFLVLATIVSTFVVQILLFVRARTAGFAAWIVMSTVWALAAGLVGVGMAAWITGGYDTEQAVAMGGLIALAALAVGTVTCGLARLIGAPGLGVAGLVVVLLNLISSGGPAGEQFLPDYYHWISPWMVAGQLFISLRGVLYFNQAGVATPVLVMAGTFVAGLILMLLAELARGRARSAALQPAAAH